MTDLPPPVSELAAYGGMIHKVINDAVAGRKRYSRVKSVDRDDLFQSLFVRLIRTTQTYDLTCGTSWSGYAYTSLLLQTKTILSQIRRRCGRHRNKIEHIPMSDVSQRMVWGTHPVYAREDSRLVELDRLDENEFVVTTVERLLAAVNPPRYRRVLRGYYGVGCGRKNMDELAEELGVSKQRVYQILDKARDKMRNAARPQGQRPIDRTRSESRS